MATYTQHAASRDNLRQRRVVPVSADAEAKRVAWRRQRAELTPKPVVREDGVEVEEDEDGKTVQSDR